MVRLRPGKSNVRAAAAPTADLAQQIDSLLNSDARLDHSLALYGTLWRSLSTDASSDTSSINTNYPRDEVNAHSILLNACIHTMSDKAQTHARAMSKGVAHEQRFTRSGRIAGAGVGRTRAGLCGRDGGDSILGRQEEEVGSGASKAKQDGAFHSLGCARGACNDLWEEAERMRDMDKGNKALESWKERGGQCRRASITGGSQGDGNASTELTAAGGERDRNASTETTAAGGERNRNASINGDVFDNTASAGGEAMEEDEDDGAEDVEQVRTAAGPLSEDSPGSQQEEHDDSPVSSWSDYYPDPAISTCGFHLRRPSSLSQQSIYDVRTPLWA
ncbi:unnamed protein product [Zymoseptoria tritici ST99CH_1E4]|uniref:Uncharacterized protein n=1 Tax=Zymoseptoria tritici ST99CH_1E4 TaxID=1276532 RepID=A0A2H1H9M4_ZYMTR|nr:unnamed protein product [Zymoseptoria tritici ST99CH_1E4]